MVETLYECPRCHRRLPRSLFGSKRTGERLQICLADISKNINKKKREHEVIAVTSAIVCQEIVSRGLNAYVSVDLGDASVPSSLRDADRITKDLLLPYINDLATSLWQESNVRFFHKITDEGVRHINFHYICAQDVNKARIVVSEHRDREAMQRGQCNSLLSFAYDRLTNYLLIKATHEDAHPPYVDKTIPMIVREFIKGNVRHSPAQIYQMMLREEGLEEHITDVTVPQVRYFWHNLTCQTWLRDKDPLLSAQIYANEVERIKCLLLTCPGYKGLLLINRVATSHLSRPGLVQELTMDATYGTNSGIYSLFAVLAEVDGTGILLAYVFANPTGDRTLSTSAPLMELLHQVLSKVREEGFDPAFFGCDKDLAEKCNLVRISERQNTAVLLACATSNTFKAKFVRSHLWSHL